MRDPRTHRGGRLQVMLHPEHHKHNKLITAGLVGHIPDTNANADAEQLCVSIKGVQNTRPRATLAGTPLNWLRQDQHKYWKKIIHHEQEAKMENLKQNIADLAKAAANVAREAADAFEAAAAAKILEQDFWRAVDEPNTCFHCGSSCSWRDDGEDGCFCGDGEC